MALGAGGSRRLSNTPPSPDGKLCLKAQLSDHVLVPHELQLQVEARAATLRFCMSYSSRYMHPSGSNMGQGEAVSSRGVSSEGLQTCFENLVSIFERTSG